MYRILLLSLISIALGPSGWSGDCSGRVLSELEELRSRLNEDPVIQDFVKENREFTEVTGKDNAAYIALAEKQFNAAHPDPRLIFVHGEYTVLKQLNDKIIGDKSIVDAYFNSFKKTLYREVMADPVLSKSVAAKASQGKLMEFVLQSDGTLRGTADLDARFQKVYARAVLVTQRRVQNSPVYKLIGNVGGYAEQPSKWFLFGFGNTQEEAEIAARELKSAPETQTGKIARAGNFKSSECVDRVRANLVSIARLRQELAEDTPELFEPIPGRPEKSSLKRGAISLLRTTTGQDYNDYLAILQRRFHDEMGMEVSLAELARLKDYFNRVDRYALSKVEGEPVRIPFETVRGDIMTDDLKGQGVENVKVLMENLTSLETPNPSPAQLMRIARQSEQQATERMNAVSEQFHAVAAGVKYGRGDDRYAFAEGSIPMANRKRQIVELAKKGNPDRHRPTYTDFVYGDTGRRVPAEKLPDFIGRAEGLEKKLQSDATLLHLVPKDMIFSISVSPLSDGSGEVTVITSSRLVPALQPIIRRELQESLTAANLKLVGFL